jgi:hypothetical protein
MDLSKLRPITNNHQDVHLVTLREWKNASEINPRDPGGPYVVSQEGYDPADPTTAPDEFLLGKSGRWITTAFFLTLPVAARREEFIFGTAAEVIEVMESLPSKAAVLRPGEELAPPEPEPAADELNTTFFQAKQKPAAG